MDSIEQTKREYLEKIFDACFKDGERCDLIISASYSLDDVKDIILGLKDQYNINQVIFFDFDYEQMKGLSERELTPAEIERLIPKYEIPQGKTKIMYFINDTTSKTIIYEECYIRYAQYWGMVNPEIMKICAENDTSKLIVTVCPNKLWAKALYGSEDRLDDLWQLINQSVPSRETLHEEIEMLIEMQRKLEMLRIHNLEFHTDLGTDFRISLTKHSVWVFEQSLKNKKGFYYNFPSFEIFTAPNCHSAEGRIVTSRKHRFYYDIFLERATLVFKKGKIVGCEADNEIFGRIIQYPQTRLNRIGEIALVSQDSFLSRQNIFFDSILLDENTGCHFALGEAFKECTDLPSELIRKRGLRHYRFNTSNYHEDMVFGDESITVDAQTYGGQKVLIMEKGRWKL